MGLNKSQILTIIDQLYSAKINNLIGYNLNNLTFNKSNVTLKDCKDCEKEFSVTDIGLGEDNLSLFWQYCKSAISNDYCAGINKNEDKSFEYRFCYNESCFDLIVDAIKKMDQIIAISRARYNLIKRCDTRIQHKKFVSNTFIKKNFDNWSKSLTKTREKMWNEIDEGLRRLLKVPQQTWKNTPTYHGEFSDQDGLKIRFLHGNLLRRLIRNDRYDVVPQKVDVILMGHYHLLMVFKKSNTWIVIVGHYEMSKLKRRTGFLSHVGSAIMIVNEITQTPSFKLIRGQGFF